MLLDDFGKICVFKEKTRTPDGEGGYYIDWTDGAEFRREPEKNEQVHDAELDVFYKGY